MNSSKTASLPNTATRSVVGYLTKTLLSLLNGAKVLLLVANPPREIIPYGKAAVDALCGMTSEEIERAP
jgi:hypothetical protein